MVEGAEPLCLDPATDKLLLFRFCSSCLGSLLCCSCLGLASVTAIECSATPAQVAVYTMSIDSPCVEYCHCELNKGRLLDLDDAMSCAIYSQATGQYCIQLEARIACCAAHKCVQYMASINKIVVCLLQSVLIFMGGPCIELGNSHYMP